MKGALVTGGASGIGLACARMLREEGYGVAICGRDRRKLAAAERDIPGVIAFPCDITNRPSVDAFVGSAVEHLGGLDVVIANAGTFPRRAAIDAITDEEWHSSIATNLTGVFYTLAATFGYLRERRGYAFTIDSIYGRHGLRLGASYAAAKWGVLGLTHSLIQEAAEQGVRATAICPGIVDTPMVGGTVPAEELLSPHDIAQTVRWCLQLSPVALVREVMLERLSFGRVDPERQEPREGASSH